MSFVSILKIVVGVFLIFPTVFGGTIRRSEATSTSHEDGIEEHARSIRHLQATADSNEENDGTKSLRSTFSWGDQFDRAAFFEIQSRKIPLQITSLEFPTTSEKSAKVRVWTKTGKYKGHESNLNAWNQVCETTIDRPSGNGVWTVMIPAQSFYPVSLGANERQSFLVELDTPTLITSYVDAAQVESVASKNNDLILHIGQVAANMTADDTIPKVAPGAWNGVVKYVLIPPTPAPVPPPTPAPTLAPTMVPATKKLGRKATPLETQVLLRLYHHHHHRRQLLPQGVDPKEELQKVSKDFLSELLQHEGDVSVKEVHIADPDHVLVDESSITLQEDSEMVHQDYYVGVSGEYFPPPEVNFQEVVERTFHDKGDVLVEKLKNTTNFRETSSIGVQAIPFQMLGMPARKYSVRMIILICSLIGAAAVLIGGVTLYVGFKRRKQIPKKKPIKADEISFAGRERDYDDW